MPQHQPPIQRGTAFATWTRRYRLALFLTGGFVVLLIALFILSPARRAPASRLVESRPTTAVEGVQHTPCPACGIGQRCGASGSCQLESQEPLECVKGSHFDRQNGYCVPDPTPRATPYPTRTWRPGLRPAPTPSGGVRTPQPSPTAGATSTPDREPAPTTTPGGD